MAVYETLDAALDALKANNDRLSKTIREIRRQITFHEYLANEDKPMMKYLTRLIADNARMRRMTYTDLSTEARIGIENKISRNDKIIARIMKLKSF